MLDKIERQNASLRSVYFDGGRCYDGFVLAYNRREVLMCLVDDAGEYDGVAYFYRSFIRYVETGTKQLGRLEKLWDQKRQVAPVIPIADEEHIRTAFLTYIYENKQNVSIGVGAEAVCDRLGRIAGMADRMLELSLLYEEGTVEIPIRNIHVAVCDEKAQRYEAACEEAQRDASLKNILSRSLTEGKMIGVFRDPEDITSFTAGYVAAVQGEEFLLQRVTTTGEYDGFGIYCMEELLLLEIDTSYLRKLSLLYQKRGQHHEPIASTGDLTEDLLRFAYTRKKRITLEIARSGRNDIYGVIHSRRDHHILAVRLIEDDHDSGMAYVDVHHITDILCDTVEDRWWSLI